MDIKHKISFFNTEDITLLMEVRGKKYEKNNPIHQKKGNQLRDGVWEKILYWKELVIDQLVEYDYVKTRSVRRWQHSGTFINYIWTQICKQGDEKKGVYFTVGVGLAGLNYELDYQQFDSANIKLSINQRVICKSLIKKKNNVRISVPTDKLHEYTWDKLVKETVDFVIKYTSLYDEVIEKVYNLNQKRIARITYNTEGWIEPSGSYGKSKDKNSFESENGYGHEEWLFDISKVYNGYHYAFLEPIRKEHQAYDGNTYDVVLFTINGETKQRYYIGEIFNVEVISEIEAKKACLYYKEQGWLDEMIDQVEEVSNYKGFSRWKGLEVFNIRFKVSHIKQVESLNIPIPKGHPIYNLNRYSFNIYKEEYKLEDTQKANSCLFDTTGNSLPNEDTLGLRTRTYDREPKTIEIRELHYAISNKLLKKLREEDKNAKCEVYAGYDNNRVDIVVRESDGDIYYEIKTYPSLKISIRMAIGQLLEYTMWTKYNRAKELIIVTQPMPDIDEVKVYFTHIRKTYNIPLYYQSFDIDTNELSKKV